MAGFIETSPWSSEALVAYYSQKMGNHRGRILSMLSEDMVTVFLVTKRDRELFPEIPPKYRYAALHQLEDGSIQVELLTTKQKKNLENKIRCILEDMLEDPDDSFYEFYE